MSERENSYDKHDRIRRGAVIIAGPLKMAAYHVRDPQTDEWSTHQFHATFDNMILAMMGEETAKLFARFVVSTLGGVVTYPEPQ